MCINMHSARMKNAPSQTMIRAWARLMRAQHAALSQIEAALKGAGLPPFAWYDVLLELERALLLPQYGLSRLLDRLEAAGDVERRACDDDGRGQIVAVTKAGRGGARCGRSTRRPSSRHGDAPVERRRRRSR
jgi:DNA-binding MarR family transcriptional regulator